MKLPGAVPSGPNVKVPTVKTSVPKVGNIGAGSLRVPLQRMIFRPPKPVKATGERMPTAKMPSLRSGGSR